MTRFELATPATRTRCATKLRHIPTFLYRSVVCPLDGSTSSRSFALCATASPQKWHLVIFSSAECHIPTFLYRFMVWQLHLRCATICLLTSSDGLSCAPHPDNILFNFQNTEKRIAPRKNNNNTSLFSIKIFLNPFAWAFYMRLKREKYNKIEKISRYGEKIMHDIPKMILKPVFNPLTCPISVGHFLRTVQYMPFGSSPYSCVCSRLISPSVSS